MGSCYSNRCQGADLLCNTLIPNDRVYCKRCECTTSPCRNQRTGSSVFCYNHEQFKIITY